MVMVESGKDGGEHKEMAKNGGFGQQHFEKSDLFLF